MDGLMDWQARLIRPIGSFRDRIAEHPIRLLRYFRRAVELGFELDGAVRRGAEAAATECRQRVPPEAIADELRRVLLRCPSPGLWLLGLAECRALPVLFPLLWPQFDGRPAGPSRYHPEVSQALHLVLALRAAAHTARDRDLAEEERLALLLAVLCHDLGKGTTSASEWPHHHGHEAQSERLAEEFLDTLPSLADRPTRGLVGAVARLHALGRGLTRLRAGTAVGLWEELFRQPGFRPDLFALALACDQAGRLPPETIGLPAATDAADLDTEAARILADLQNLDQACRTVDAAILRQECGDDLDRFRQRLHAERCRALRSSMGRPEESVP
jgi:tRNA nucleotidyltransferase (CCA-adding enzyme)